MTDIPIVEKVARAIWREDHYDPKLCSHSGDGGEMCAYCEPHDDDTPDEWPADKERAERQARAAIEASGLKECVEALEELQAEFCEYHCGTSISGPDHEPECDRARATLAAMTKGEE